LQEQGIDGDALVFLSGWEDISSLKERLENRASPFSSQRYVILPLHSQIAPDEQRRVFDYSEGVRKIILATNIAETAITIDGIVCIINTGRVKEKRFDPYCGVSTLQTTWITKASERQRRGRAGRTRAGIAFHLYSRQRSRELQANSPLPLNSSIAVPFVSCTFHVGWDTHFDSDAPVAMDSDNDAPVAMDSDSDAPVAIDSEA
jgi:HrpA-like RNA helicase